MKENKKLMEIHVNRLNQKLNAMYDSINGIYIIKEMTDQFELQNEQNSLRLE
jgi:hypothetical protein